MLSGDDLTLKKGSYGRDVAQATYDKYMVTLILNEPYPYVYDSYFIMRYGEIETNYGEIIRPYCGSVRTRLKITLSLATIQ